MVYRQLVSCPNDLQPTAQGGDASHGSSDIFRFRKLICLSTTVAFAWNVGTDQNKATSNDVSVTLHPTKHKHELQLRHGSCDQASTAGNFAGGGFWRRGVAFACMLSLFSLSPRCWQCMNELPALQPSAQLTAEWPLQLREISGMVLDVRCFARIIACRTSGGGLETCGSTLKCLAVPTATCAHEHDI